MPSNSFVQGGRVNVVTYTEVLNLYITFAALTLEMNRDYAQILFDTNTLIANYF